MAIINHLITEFNHKNIDDNFDFYVLTTKDNYVKRGAYVLDKPINNLKALSLAYENGKHIFIMFKKNCISKAELSNAIEDEIITVEKICSCDIKDYILFRLFLYGLNNYDSDEMSFNNLTGKLFVYSPNWMSKNRKSFMALYIDVDQNLNIRGEATTFSSLSLFSDKVKNDYSYPRYSFSINNSLKRELHNDSDVYIRKPLFNTKAEIPFLDLSDLKKRTTKVYYLYFILNLLKEKYNDCLSLYFDDIDVVDAIGKIKDKNVIDKCMDILNNKKVNLVNLIMQSEFSNDIEELYNVLKTKLPNAKLSDSIVKDELNIVFIHNKEYYLEKGYNDPYKSFDRKTVIQCVTYEDSIGKIINDNESIVNTIIKELVIKNEIINGHLIEIDSWNDYAYSNDFIFGKEKDDHMYFMNINCNGNFELFNKADDFSKFKDERIQECAEILSNYKGKEKSIISDGLGNVIIISRTNLYCLPKEDIFNINNVSRGKESREELIKGIVDINLYEYNNDIYFSSGMIGSGMKTGIPKASLLYKVDVIKGNNIFNELLKTLSVSFVKYKSFTVLPYPFKYLNEYIEIEGK